jgi:transposase
MSKILSLQGVIINKIEESTNEFLIKVHILRKKVNCTHCLSSNVIKNGKGKTRKVRHGLSVEKLPMYLEFKSKRFKCKNCKKTFTISLPKEILESRKRYSNLCIKQAINLLKITNFNTTKNETGLSYYLLHKALNEFYEKNKIIKIPKNCNLTIGVDGHSRSGHNMSTTITLIRPERKLLGLLPYESSSELVNFFTNNFTEEERLRVDEISMDMTNNNLGILKLLFPNTKFVIDKFHLIKYLNDMITEEYKTESNIKNLINGLGFRRRSLNTRLPRAIYMHKHQWSFKQKKRLDEIFTNFSKLKHLYDIKEQIRFIYNKNHSSKEEWLNLLNQLPIEYSKTLIKRIDDVLNYYTNKTTNAYTEGLHTKIKLFKRLSYGIRNPDTYVKKIFLSVIST